MPLLIVLLIKVVFGGICAAIADSRGRNAVGWFFVGALFDCIALVILLVIPDLKKQQAMEQKLRDENRLLREQVRSNRLVHDQRLDTTDRRLAIHDRARGVDTSAPAEIAAPAAAATPPPPLPAGTRPGFDGVGWHYARQDRANGPVSFADLKALFRSGDLTAESLVWSDGMPSWTAARDVSGLMDAIHA
jgi:hypothetical protein